MSPDSIPDYLALVGDSADGIPGIPGWGAKSPAALLTAFKHIGAIPEDIEEWDMMPGRARRLAENLRARADEALLCRSLATLRLDVPIEEHPRELEWKGAREGFRSLCAELGNSDLPARMPMWRKS